MPRDECPKSVKMTGAIRAGFAAPVPIAASSRVVPTQIQRGGSILGRLRTSLRRLRVDPAMMTPSPQIGAGTSLMRSGYALPAQRGSTPMRVDSLYQNCMLGR